MLHELIKDTQDCKFLRDQLLNVFLPTRDVSSTGLSGLFFHLARNPRVWTKLRSEVLKIDQPLTVDMIKSIKYPHCVLRETPTDVSRRTYLSDCVLPSGGGKSGHERIYVHTATRLEMRFGNMQRDSDYWSPVAKDFRPERWLDNSLLPKYDFDAVRFCSRQVLRMRIKGIENRDPDVKSVNEIKFRKKRVATA